MNNVLVYITMKLNKEMTEKEIESMIDQMVLKEDKIKLWTVKVEDAPNQTWVGV